MRYTFAFGSISSIAIDVSTGTTAALFTSRLANTASRRSPPTNCPCSSTATIRSPSPSCAIPRSDSVARTVLRSSSRFSSVGSGSRPGKSPSGCAFIAVTLHPSSRRTEGVIVDVAPLPQSTTTLRLA